MDLMLKFDTEEILTALGPVNYGNEIVLALTAQLTDGTFIEGQDCIVVLYKGIK